MQFLLPRPSSTGSMTALPAPAGGGFGLFKAYSTQRNCLPLRWASVKTQNGRSAARKRATEAPTMRNTGLWSQKPSSSFSPPGLGDLSTGTEIRQTRFSTQLCHLLAPQSGLPAGAAELRKDSLSSTLLPV